MLGEDILGRSISNAAVRIHVARCTMFSVATRKLIESQSASLCQRVKGYRLFQSASGVGGGVGLLWLLFGGRATFRSKKSGRRDS
jgi:hypothetical protein